MDPIYEYLYTPPGRMDGDPAEVATKAREQLVDVIDWLDELAAETAVQLENSYKTVVLTDAPSTDAAQLAEEWEQSDAKARIDRIRTLAGALTTAIKSA